MDLQTHPTVLSVPAGYQRGRGLPSLLSYPDSPITVDVSGGEHGNVAERDAEPEEDEDPDRGGEGRADSEQDQAGGDHQEGASTTEPAKRINCQKYCTKITKFRVVFFRET